MARYCWARRESNGLLTEDLQASKEAYPNHVW
jgi:hypothetical protein